MTTTQKIFEHQIWHLLSLIFLILAIKLYVSSSPEILDGLFWGISTNSWFWLAIATPIIHQIYVWLVWRFELYLRVFSNKFGTKQAFNIYAVGFSFLFISRLITIIFLAIVLVYLFYKVIKFKKYNDDLVSENFQLKQDNRKLKQIEKIKSEFINVAAHQIRTPLAKIKWVLRSVISGEAGAINQEQKGMLDSAYQFNEKMIDLLNDLLNVGKTEDINFGYNFKKSSIEEIAKETLKNFSLAARKKNIDLVLMKEDNGIPKITADPHKIGMVFDNLIDNAINYTPKGGRIGVILENFGDYVKISVKDNGIGVPKEDAERIFSRFFRAKNAIRVETEGTGLGLYIAKNIIKAHGGDIWFESERANGTTFYFTIPFRSEKEIRKNLESFIRNI